MTRELMLQILSGDSAALMRYCHQRGYDYSIVRFGVLSSQDYLLSAWEINTIYDKNGKFVKHYL
jgi:hypothetical protein